MSTLDYHPDSRRTVDPAGELPPLVAYADTATSASLAELATAEAVRASRNLPDTAQILADETPDGTPDAGEMRDTSYEATDLPEADGSSCEDAALPLAPANI